MAVFPGFEWVALALLAVGVGGGVVNALRFNEFLRAAKPKQRVFPLARAAAILFFVGVALLGAFAYSYSETTRYTQATFEGGGNPALTARTPEYRVIESKTDTFTKQISPVECEGMRDLVYWRELRVYNSTLTDAFGKNKTVYYSTFTLTVENNGSQAVSNVLVTEHIPEIVAAEPGQVFNFTVRPVSVRKGSVVVEWMFDKIEPGEKKSASYTVEKRVDAKSVEEFDAPNVVAQAIKTGAATAAAGAGEEVVEVPAQRAGVDWTLPGLVVAMSLVGAFVYFITRKTQAQQA